MATQRNLSPSLAALMSAAAALAPNAHAQTAPVAESDSRVSYRFNEYGEDGYNGAAIGSQARKLNDNDVIQLAGVKMGFFEV